MPAEADINRVLRSTVKQALNGDMKQEDWFSKALNGKTWQEYEISDPAVKFLVCLFGFCCFAQDADVRG